MNKINFYHVLVYEHFLLTNASTQMLGSLGGNLVFLFSTRWYILKLNADNLFFLLNYILNIKQKEQNFQNNGFLPANMAGRADDGKAATVIVCQLLKFTAPSVIAAQLSHFILLHSASIFLCNTDVIYQVL